ncbi:MAG TPA: hypothetical protein VFX49_12370 [Chloroflexota bacterium]|nr:hypothetical protein [Chloroflexota bacterium]
MPAVGETEATDTVVHDPQGRPWLVSTAEVGDGAYETQVFYTARAGIRGFPTGHGERYDARAAASGGHRAWCLRVRQGEVLPDLPPAAPL